MTVTCPSCHASLTVPDDRIPKGKTIQAACPRCKAAIRLGDPAPAPPAPPRAAAEAAKVASAPPTPLAYGAQRQPRALVCVEPGDEQARVMAIVKEAGYQAHAPADPAQAIERLRFTPHALAVVQDGFGGRNGERSPFMETVAEIGMGMRRHLLVVLVSDRVPALDPMVAFASSVDLVIHPNDLGHLPDALQRCTAEAERKYHVLEESMRALGKG
jgi:hypothetical protein